MPVINRRRTRVTAGCLLLVLSLIAPPDHAVATGGSDVAAERPGVAEKTAGFERRAGLLDLWIDARGGKIWLELPPPDRDGEIAELLYVEGLVSGLGSNPVGLDRGQLGASRVVRLRRMGGRILLEQPNLAYRALSDDPHERRAVTEGFATSVLWSGEIAAEDPDLRSLVDFTSFVVRDAHGVVARLGAAEQGAFQLDAARSAVDFTRCLAFPDNVELAALLTYAGTDPGRDVRQVAPQPESVSLLQHHALIRLPDDNYVPRAFDPRAGSFAIAFLDYAAPLDAPIERRWIVRHRLNKTDPARERSGVEEPIVYYVDRGAPEPIRSALIEGAAWWSRAFEAAGFDDAFRVELLPEGVHPLDIRYNVIEWVHRATRGWSYGGGVIDPRTGEMIKGHVSLGSLRVRQDRLLFEGLLGTEATGSGSVGDPVELALSRIRQLAAHEVGHTLGLAHNFAASTYDDRASVMDYPAPRIQLAPDGGLDVSTAYGVGVGSWDLHAVRYAYTELAPGVDEATALRRIVAEGLEAGLLFLTDEDARPLGAAHPKASLWDNGVNAVAELGRTLAVRRVALDGFGERNVADGTPLARLEEVLATVYLHHRFQLEAAIKVVGGLDYRYALRGDRQPPLRPLDAAYQRAALDVVLGTLDPAFLDLPDALLARIPPRPPGHAPHRELFQGRTAPMFDPLAAAETAADMAVAGLLQPERAARLVELQRRDPDQPGLETVLDRLVERAFALPSRMPPRHAELQRVVQRVVVARLIGLAGDAAVAPAVRSRLEARLGTLAALLEAPAGDAAERTHRSWLRGEVRRFLERPAGPARPPAIAPAPPPGSPIGAAACCSTFSGPAGLPTDPPRDCAGR